MSIKYTIIESQRQKWLSQVAPHGVDPAAFHANVPDLPYIGNRGMGSTVDESEVREVRQHRHKDDPKDAFFTLNDNTLWLWENRSDHRDIEFRIAYTDAESHDHDISDDYWKIRAKAAEKLIGISPSDPKTYDEFCRIREEWEQIVKQEPK